MSKHYDPDRYPTLDAYDRIYIGTAGQTDMFIYIAHFHDANHIQLGFGTEAHSGLKVNHAPGPHIHSEHLTDFLAWLEAHGEITYVDQARGFHGSKDINHHPFSSSGFMDYKEIGDRFQGLQLSAGQYDGFAQSGAIRPDVIRTKLHAAIISLRNEVWGHPEDWEFAIVPTGDGRFSWVTYDSDADRLRLGIGYYGEQNEPIIGTPCFLLRKTDYAHFAAKHFYYVDAPLQCWGMPPRWPVGFSPFIAGNAKRGLAVKVLETGDRVWGLTTR